MAGVKKIALLLLLVLVSGIVALVAQQRGLLSSNPDRAMLQRLSQRFMEDLQYKDFSKAALYHTYEDQQKADIGQLIQRMFLVKPEQLNIRNVRIVGVDFDSSGDRARAFVTCTNEVLNSGDKAKDEKNRAKQVEAILYWHRRPAREAYPSDEVLKEAVKAGKTMPEVQEIQDPKQTGETRWFLRLESSLH